MEESYSIGECVSTSVYESYLRERTRDFMTCLIQMKTKNMVCVGADSWNTNLDNHHIQKIFVNKQYPIIIASAGENGKKYDNSDKVITIQQIVEGILKKYDGNNIETILEMLEVATKDFLRDMKIPNDRLSVFVQYYVCYIEKGEFVTKRLECVKDNQYDFEPKCITLSSIFINPNLNCLGKYKDYFNKKYLNCTVKNSPNMHEIMKNYVNQHIKKDKKESRGRKTVGGAIYVATMSKEGIIKTYINGVEKDF